MYSRMASYVLDVTGLLWRVLIVSGLLLTGRGDCATNLWCGSHAVLALLWQLVGPQM
jgi:hypothetical protein